VRAELSLGYELALVKLQIDSVFGLFKQSVCKFRKNYQGLLRVI